MFLQTLECEIVPAVRAEADAPCILAGYSLAGLCAAYAAYRTTAFSGVISASGSLWFPGFLDFAASHAFARKPERVYFSLGDKESRTKNPVMRLVEDNTRKLCDAYAAQGIEMTFERNPGNHFQDAELRLAKGVTFSYGADGRPVSHCRGERLFYVMTAGGPILPSNHGYGYVKSLAETLCDTDSFPVRELPPFLGKTDALLAGQIAGTMLATA